MTGATGENSATGETRGEVKFWVLGFRILEPRPG